METTFLEFLKSNYSNLKKGIFLQPAYCHKPRGCYIAKISLSFSPLEILAYIKPQVNCLLYEPKEFLVFKILIKEKFYKIFMGKEELRWGIVSDKEEAENIFDEIVTFLENCLQKIPEIKPDFTPMKRASALEYYKKLPKTNCRECGEPSCMALAIKISIGEAELSDCPFTLSSH